MKSLLLSLLLVPMTTCLLDGDAFSRGSCLQKINEARSAFADRYQLANMNDLMYNKKLEKSILEQLSFTRGCPQPSIISHNQLDFYLNVKGTDLIVELLAATGSTQMACVKTKCGDEDVISIVTDVSDLWLTWLRVFFRKILQLHRIVHSGESSQWLRSKRILGASVVTDIGKDTLEEVGQIAIDTAKTVKDGLNDVANDLLPKKTYYESRTVADSAGHGYARKGIFDNISLSKESMEAMANASKEIAKMLKKRIEAADVEKKRKETIEAIQKIAQESMSKAAKAVQETVKKVVTDELRGYACKGVSGTFNDRSSPTYKHPSLKEDPLELDLDWFNLEDFDVEEHVFTDNQSSDDGGFILVPERPEGFKPLYG